MSRVAVWPVTQLQIFVEHVYRCITRCSPPPNRGLQQVPFKAPSSPFIFVDRESEKERVSKRVGRRKGGRKGGREGIAKMWRKRMIPLDRTSD